MPRENFHGFAARECGDHRTVGQHRAWCHDCSEWCYPDIPCKGCELPQYRVTVERQAAELAGLRAGIVTVGTALEKLSCAVERDLNAEAGESAGCPLSEWADIHDRLAMLADECGLALNHPAVSPVMETASDLAAELDGES